MIVVVFKGIMMMDHLSNVNNAHNNVNNVQILIHVLHVAHTTRHYLNAKTVRMVITKMLVYANNVIIHARLALHNKYVWIVLLDMGLSWILIIYVIPAIGKKVILIIHKNKIYINIL